MWGPEGTSRLDTWFHSVAFLPDPLALLSEKPAWVEVIRSRLLAPLPPAAESSGGPGKSQLNRSTSTLAPSCVFRRNFLSRLRVKYKRSPTSSLGEGNWKEIHSSPTDWQRAKGLTTYSVGGAVGEAGFYSPTRFLSDAAIPTLEIYSKETWAETKNDICKRLETAETSASRGPAE